MNKCRKLSQRSNTIPSSCLATVMFCAGTPFIFNTSLGTQPCAGYSRRLPALSRIYRETKFLLLKSILNLDSRLEKTFQWFSRVFQSIFEANWSYVSWDMIGQTNRQTNKTNNKVYHVHYSELCIRKHFRRPNQPKHIEILVSLSFTRTWL